MQQARTRVFRNDNAIYGRERDRRSPTSIVRHTRASSSSVLFARKNTPVRLPRVANCSSTAIARIRVLPVRESRPLQLIQLVLSDDRDVPLNRTTSMVYGQTSGRPIRDEGNLVTAFGVRLDSW